ncbi:MAG TPA: hypothetical protein VMA09_15245 [Candidatus Binataceae bacterium]|nr:hypothetical protein [Candidatus Binataceae bacterium]
MRLALGRISRSSNGCGREKRGRDTSAIAIAPRDPWRELGGWVQLISGSGRLGISSGESPVVRHQLVSVHYDGPASDIGIEAARGEAAA